MDSQFIFANFRHYPEYFENYSSPHTRLSYLNDIKQFLRFVSERNIHHYSEIERKQVIDYRNWLQELGGRDGTPCAPKTVARKLAAISSYFHFLVEINIIKYNPATSVKRPRHQVVTPTNALTSAQVRELFAAVEANKRAGPMHKALLIMFFTTGLRKSEILNLRYCDYREINDYKVIEYKGKGGKLGQKVLHPLCIEALEDYLEWMKQNKRAHGPSDWLFRPTHNPFEPTNLDKPLNPKTINEIIDHYARKIQLNFKVSPHSARATFISELLEQGVDIYQVAREVNHSSVKTTQEYDKRRKKLSDSPVYKLHY